MPKRRKVEVAVISDVHLGNKECQAKELLAYLKSIKPKVLVLNGDIVEMRQFSKSHMPAAHMRVVKHLMGLITKGTRIYYVTGNHEQLLRKFSGFQLNSFRVVDKVVLELDGKRAWFFHGDVFDVSGRHARWLTKLGAKGYALLLLLNRLVSFGCRKLGKKQVSRSLKNRVKSAVRFIGNFEQTAAGIAISSGYDYVVCGHVHQPDIREIASRKGNVTYLNSGDWVEHLTALEYNAGAWRLYRFREDVYTIPENDDTQHEEERLTNMQHFQNLMMEFSLRSA